MLLQITCFLSTKFHMKALHNYIYTVKFYVLMFFFLELISYFGILLEIFRMTYSSLTICHHTYSC
jgi:hypothetical protein